MKHSKRIGIGATFTLCCVFGSAAAATEDWSVYRPDMKAEDVFGRPVPIQKPDTTVLLTNPSLNEIAQADVKLGANANARGALDALLASPKTVSGCQNLTALKLPWLRVLSAEHVAADTDAMAHCKVLAVVDKEINIEIDLPDPAQWNGKFLMGGGGGFLGTLENGMKPAALNRGYATGGTDTGHPIPKDVGGSWAYHDPERLVNWGHRGTHLAQANIKLVIQAYYKKAIQKSYYYGSSGSGRVAMMEAQRYPEDFNGVVAACPVFNWTKGGISMIWTQQAMYATAEDQYGFKPIVPADKVVVLDEAVYAKCDAIDGLKDGIISNPTACKFDPAKDLPRCKDGQDAAKCFTPKQIEAIARIHLGPSNANGPIWSSWPYGGESIPGQWTRDFGSAYVIGSPWASAGVRKKPDEYTARHYLLSNETFRYVVYGDPQYDIHTFNFETDVPSTYAAAAQIDADNPDLSGLKLRGGKLLMYVGYSDWAVNPLSTQNYYDRVLTTMGASAQDYARLFFVPGNGHCNSIDPTKKTPNVADFLTAMEQWVESGKAPNRIIASHVLTEKGGSLAPPLPQSMPIVGYVDRTRPLCPYPQAATYMGKGSIDDADSFVCRAPTSQVSR